MKKKKIAAIIIVVVVIAIIVIVCLLVSKRKRYSEYQDSLKYDPAVFPLKKGSRGKEVEEIQKYMNALFSSKIYKEKIGEHELLDVDGIWGDKTEAAIHGFMLQNVINEALYGSMMTYKKYRNFDSYYKAVASGKESASYKTPSRPVAVVVDGETALMDE